MKFLCLLSVIVGLGAQAAGPKTTLCESAVFFQAEKKWSAVVHSDGLLKPDFCFTAEELQKDEAAELLRPQIREPENVQIVCGLVTSDSGDGTYYALRQIQKKDTLEVRAYRLEGKSQDPGKQFSCETW